MNESDPLLLGQIVLGVLAITGFSLQAWLGMLRRKWDKQDRANEARMLVDRTNEVATLALKVAHDLADKNMRSAVSLHTELARNTAITVEAKAQAAAAYTEANNVNAKIAELAKESACRIPADAQMDHIQATTDETLDLVKDT